MFPSEPVDVVLPDVSACPPLMIHVANNWLGRKERTQHTSRDIASTRIHIVFFGFSMGRIICVLLSYIFN